MTLNIYLDGGCFPNPGGLASWGVIIREGDQDIWLGSGITGYGKSMSNNCSEYDALIQALIWLETNNRIKEDIVIYSDSQLVIFQMRGERGVKGGLYFPFYANARSRLFGKKNIRFSWIPREQNMRADALALSAYEGYRLQHPELKIPRMSKGMKIGGLQ